MTSLCARLAGVADGPGALTFVGSAAGGATAERVEWSRLHHDAVRMATALQARGVAPGSHVAILGTTTRPLVTAIEAVWLAGGTVVMLPLPMRLASLDAFVEQTRSRVASAAASLVLVDPDLAVLLPESDADGFTRVELDDLARHARATPASGYELPHDDPDRLAILQFTSGSTADPKGVMLPERCVIENTDAIVEAAAITPWDRAVSWLPLYHDMGLIGLLTTPMLNGFELVLGAPQDFLAAPACWLEWMSQFRGTITAGPNFSYALAGRALRRAGGGSIDLSSWRLALNGAEPVDPAAVEAFCAHGARHGLDAKSAYPVFGMAEATLAVTFPEPGLGMAVDVVDRAALEEEGIARPSTRGADAPRRLALLGRALRGFELRVVRTESGDVLAEREVGELELRGPSVTPGYYRNDTATAAAFRDGWFRTGDLAYLVDGQLVVCGRLKDMIIVGGRNVFPDEVERAAATVEGVRAGNVIAFGVNRRNGREGIVVVAEIKGNATSRTRDGIAAAVSDVVGIPPSEIALVRPGSLPKTSSGKLQRSLCRTQHRDAALDFV